MLEVKVTLELSKNFEVLMKNLIQSMDYRVSPELKSGVVEELKVSEPVPTKTEPIQPQPIVAPVQTAEIAYSFEQIQTCAASVARAGKRDELANALKDVGITTLMELKPEQYNSFVLKLRELGGTI